MRIIQQPAALATMTVLAFELSTTSVAQADDAAVQPAGDRHDVVLSSGAGTLDLFQANVDESIAQRQHGTPFLRTSLCQWLASCCSTGLTGQPQTNRASRVCARL